MNLRLRLSIILTLLYTMFTTSCFNPFNPDIRSSNPVESSFSTPDLTLINLEDAYNRKDINLFKQCLADNYMFQMLTSEVDDIGFDFNNDGIPDNWWGYEQEVSFHENLFVEGSSDGSRKPPDNITLNLLIPDESSWQESGAEGQENWVVITCDFFLTLSFFNGSTISSNGSATFFLKQNAQGDWQIAIWRDISNIDN